MRFFWKVFLLSTASVDKLWVEKGDTNLLAECGLKFWLGLAASRVGTPVLYYALPVSNPTYCG